MNVIHRIERWGDGHHPGILDIIRIALGIFLLVKGVLFMENTSYLKEVITNQSDIALSPDLFMFIVYYAAFIHMTCGAMMLFGILTRLSALLQLPLVFGAVFFVNILESPVNSELWLSIICLVLLLVFLVIGSGPFSMDSYLKKMDE
jgi:putative oxidoreductase